MQFPIDNSNRGRITHRMRDIIAYRSGKSPFMPTVPVFDCRPIAEQSPAQQYQRNKYIAEKHI